MAEAKDNQSNHDLKVVKLHSTYTKLLTDSHFNPSNAEATFIHSTRMQRLLTWRVGIHCKALTEYSQMRTHLPGFQSYFRFFA